MADTFPTNHNQKIATERASSQNGGTFVSNGVDGLKTLGQGIAGAALDATGLAPALERLGVLKPGGVEEEKRTPTVSFKEDFRVKIKIPTMYLQGPATELQKVGDFGVVFPYTPQIVLQTRANYNSLQPTHSNYPFYAYQNSQLDAISIVGTFSAQNEGQAKYVMGCIHAMRTVTKMHFGGSSFQGAPPPVCRLHGYGEYVFNNMPIVISSFFYTMNEDVDYIAVDIDGASTLVPTRSEFTIECLPAFSRRDAATFSIDAFASGQLRSKGMI